VDYLRCKDCIGLCCTIQGTIVLEFEDIEKLSGYFNISNEEFIDRFTQIRGINSDLIDWDEDHIEKAIEDNELGLRKIDGKNENTKCIFLDENFKCSIYEVRPETCRDYCIEECKGDGFHYIIPYLDKNKPTRQHRDANKNLYIGNQDFSKIEHKILPVSQT